MAFSMTVRSIAKLLGPSLVLLSALVGPAGVGEGTAAAAPAAPARKRAHTQARVEQPHGQSLGSPTHGQLVGGAHLTEAPYLRIVPEYAGQDVRWGLGPLVGMIDRSARQVRRHFPDAVLSVGHLSRRGGGEIDRHASHESGRDADIGFYIMNDQKKAIYEQSFVAFTGDGKAKTWPGAHFDDARNWALVVALLTDPAARVTHIFVAAPLKARLLTYAERMGAPLPLRIRASETLAQPHGALPHDDHFHVRIACPAHMSKCIEQPEVERHLVAKKTAPKGHEAHPGHDAHAATASKGRAEHPKKKTDDSDDEQPTAASQKADEAPIPRLTPEVAGLDAAVIGTPLRPREEPKAASPATPARASEPAAAPRAPEPPKEPIDDVDGVLGQ
jgi:penicillin-insensitive murein endopeptidase